MSEVVTREILEGLISEYESALRATCGKAGLPEAWARRLAAIDRTTVFGLLKYWKWLAIYSEMRRAGKDAAPVDHAGAETAARALLRREPLRVEIGPYSVNLTSRSYACMAEIARHDRRIRLLSSDSAYVEHQIRRLGAALAAVPRSGVRAKLRRDLRRYSEIATRIDREITHQRAALWSHALTPDGAPARDFELPEWWAEIDIGWDAAILRGLLEVGPARYLRLGRSPDPGRSDERPEDFGWATLFAAVERQHNLEPSSLYDRDLFQLLTWLRAGAEPVPEGARQSSGEAREEEVIRG